MELGPAPSPAPLSGWKALLRLAAGIGLMLVGVVGLILPIMPGWVFLIPGLLIVSDFFPPAKRLVEWAKAKFEDARAAARGAADRNQN